MKFRKGTKSRLTGMSFSFPFFGGGATWENTSDEREVRARSERADAFTALWTVVQDAHIGLRNDFDRVDELSDVHRQVNVLLIQKAPSLDQTDVAMAQSFLDALGTFIGMLRPASGEEADRVREEVTLTMAPVFPHGKLAELAGAYSHVEALNESLKLRYRSIVFGENP